MITHHGERTGEVDVLHNIGSVYLDGPRRRPPADPPNALRYRATVARFLAIVGIVGFTIAGALSGVRLVVQDSVSLQGAVNAAIDDPVARAEIERELAEAIQTGLVDDSLVTVAESSGVDVESQSAALAASLLDDPAFREAIDKTVDDIHWRVFVDPGTGQLDTSDLADAAIAAADDMAPALATTLPPDGQLLTVESDAIPDLSGPTRLLDQAILAALVLGAGLPAAYAAHHSRDHVLTWYGRWLLTAGLVLALAAVGLPHLAARATGFSTVEATVRSLTLRLLAPAVVVGVTGMGLVSFASVQKRRRERSNVDQGRTVALGVDEFTSSQPAVATVGLAHRGLVEGSRPLTNI